MKKILALCLLINITVFAQTKKIHIDSLKTKITIVKDSAKLTPNNFKNIKIGTTIHNQEK